MPDKPSCLQCPAFNQHSCRSVYVSGNCAVCSPHSSRALARLFAYKDYILLFAIIPIIIILAHIILD